MYYSTGGGFISTQEELEEVQSTPGGDSVAPLSPEPPFKYSLSLFSLIESSTPSYHTSKELIQMCEDNNFSIAEIQMKNEISFGRTEDQVLYCFA